MACVVRIHNVNETAASLYHSYDARLRNEHKADG